MKKLLIALLFLSGCSALPAVEPLPVDQQLKQHEIIIQGIVNYIAVLQERGMLPKPSEIEKK